jgi:uncharacterized protein (DUF433 family)
MSTPKSPHKRATAAQMEVRQIRILGWLQGGLSHEEIAGLEGISRERVRQIVVQALKEREEDRSIDRRLLAEVRLAPALRLAARAIVEGKLEGVDRLIKVIDRLEKLQGPAPRHHYDESARAKLLAKLSRPSSSSEGARTDQSEKAPEDTASL